MVKRKFKYISIFCFLTVFTVITGCSKKAFEPPEENAEPEPTERIVFNRGVLYYDSPDVVFVKDTADGIVVIERGIERLLYKPDLGEEAVALAVNPDYVYFAVETHNRTEIKRVATFNLGGLIEDYGEFDRPLNAPYYINSEGDLIFAYVHYGEEGVRLLAYELPRAEPVAMSLPLPGIDVALFPAPEPDATYAVVARTDDDADIYYFTEEGNTTSLIIDGIKFEEYYLENDRPFAVISEPVSPRVLAGVNSMGLNETAVSPKDPSALFCTRILDLKGRGSIPVYYISETENNKGKPLDENGARNVLDGDMNTAWVVKTESELEERTVKIDFARPRPIRGLKVYSGVVKDDAGLVRAGRTIAITAELSDGSAMGITFDEDSVLAIAERESNKPVEWVVLTVDPTSVEGEKACFVNEIQLY